MQMVYAPFMEVCKERVINCKGWAPYFLFHFYFIFIYQIFFVIFILFFVIAIYATIDLNLHKLSFIYIVTPLDIYYYMKDIPYLYGILKDIL